MFVESGILGFGFWNSTFGIWNSAHKCGIPQQLESVIQVQLTRNPESSIWSPESTTWNPSRWKTFLDYLIWGEMSETFIMRRVQLRTCALQSWLQVSSFFCMESQSSKKEIVLGNPSNSTLNMLLKVQLSIYGQLFCLTLQFRRVSRRPQINMGNSI